MIEEGIKVRFTGDSSGLTKSLSDLQGQLGRFESRLKSIPTGTESFNRLQRAVEATKQRIASFNTTVGNIKGASDRSTQALSNLSRIAQDAPYGFIGIANNINPMLESFQRLQKETGSTSLALKSMVGALAGPAGIGLAVGVVSSLLVTFGDKLFRSSEASQKAAENLKKAKEEQEAFSQSLKDAEAGARAAGLSLRSYLSIASDMSQSAATQRFALDKVNEGLSKYGIQITEAQVKSGEAKKVIDQLTQALIQQAVASKYADRVANLFIKQTEASKEYAAAEKNLREEREKTRRLTDQLTSDPVVAARESTAARLKRQADAEREAYNNLVKVAGGYKTTTKELIAITGDLGNAQQKAANIFSAFNPGPAEGSVDSLRKKLKELQDQYNKTGDAAVRAKLVPQIQDVKRQIDAIDEQIETRAKKQPKIITRRVDVLPDIKISPEVEKWLQQAARNELPFQKDIVNALEGSKITGKVTADVELGVNATVGQIKLRNVGDKIAGSLGEDFAKEFQSIFNESIDKAVASGLDGEALSQFADQLQIKMTAGALGIQTVANAFGDMVENIGQGKNAIEVFANAMISSLKRLAAQLLQTAILAFALSTISGGSITFGSAFKKILGFSKGGIVPGAGNSDSVPALLTPGELVVPKSMVQQLRAGTLNIDSINRLVGSKMAGRTGGASLPTGSNKIGTMSAPMIASTSTSFPDYIPVLRDDQIMLMINRATKKQGGYN